MVVSEQALAGAPAPEDCDHPSPVLGVMAHEFAPFAGAQGPEGPRRTTMHYGPIVGGLPIQAWHCQVCGLLRLEYPDGRREERRLHPGPQPGLIAVPLPEDPQQEHYGMQARVSGLSAPPAFFDTYGTPVAASPPLLSRIAQRIPPLGTVTWLTVAGLVLVAAGLLAAGILAVYDVQTPSAEGPVVALVAATFVAVLLLQIGAAGFRQLFPPGRLSPSPAVSGRGRPDLDSATKAAVTLLVAGIVGLLLSALLATYDVQTSPAEGPVLALSLACCVAAAVVKLVDRARRHFGGEKDGPPPAP